MMRRSIVSQRLLLLLPVVVVALVLLLHLPLVRLRHQPANHPAQPIAMEQENTSWWHSSRIWAPRHRSGTTSATY
uniref:Putative secreted protein n=1 Tax=Anopheles darlingi TaxID=43151 RepID=A0A2M4D7K5_ANODA